MNEIAHTTNGIQRQGLLEHLQNVAELAARFAQPFGASDLAYLAGLLHDIGKFDPAFQHYLLDAEANPKQHGRGPDHKGAGAVLAVQKGIEALAFLIAGHHGGLPVKKILKNEWLPGRMNDAAVAVAIQIAQQALPELHRIDLQTTLTLWSTLNSEYEQELFLRMVFSALVDADFLDTERHFTAGKEQEREGYPTLAELWTWFQEDQRLLSGQHSNTLNPLRHEIYEQCPQAVTPPPVAPTLNELRHEIYKQCVAAATWEPGFFRLTVPTGGGKTRSSLAFALAHALAHGKERVIYAIPYMSITEQTTGVFRDIFDAQNSQSVLEHHSGVTASDPDNPSMQEIWANLASENWDAPLIVTTTVQLFQSLLAAKTTPCRKLHAIANSVIILDEVQTLPPQLLTTILDVLRQLVARYHVTVVLCTATQPALDDQPDFKGLPQVREIVPDPSRLFVKLKRVHYQWPERDTPWSWAQVAERMQAERQALAIVNTRRDAAALLNAINHATALHLSTWMCGAHRRAVLAEARHRLQEDETCWLVSTQLIEAGVDIDFPLVLRAMGPLDSIVQAAGRCNREGKLPLGEVIVFLPEEGKLPPGAYRVGTDVTRVLAASGSLDPLDRLDLAEVYPTYSRRYYGQLDRDAKKVQPMRKLLDFPEVATRFQMIDDDTTPVIVRYKPLEEKIKDLLARLRKNPAQARKLLRQLQPYMVNLRQRELLLAKKQGMAVEIAEVPDIWIWQGGYDNARGIVLEGGIDPGLLFW